MKASEHQSEGTKGERLSEVHFLDWARAVKEEGEVETSERDWWYGIQKPS
jgi:hypothetical protein